MVHLEIQYFNLNRILLLVIGLWPYQQSKLTQFQFIFFSIILTTGIIFQLTTLITSRCTPILVCQVLSSAFVSIFSAIKYNFFYINIKGVKDLLMQLEHIYKQIKDKNEVAIIEEYNCIARRYTITLTIFISIGLVLLIGQNCLNILIVLPKNVSISLPIMMEYFIDQKKYFYLILLHFYAILCFGTLVTFAIGTLSIAYLQHICGMFRIACYRIEHAIKNNIRQRTTLEKKIFMTKGIICAVEIHRQAMKLTRHFLSLFEVMLFCLIVCGVACLALNLFQITSSKNDIKEFLMPSLIVSVCIIYMFIANYMGQNIIDHNKHVFSTAYNVQWYRTPLHTQRLILFLLQKTAKEFTMNVGGIFDPSVECFAMLLKSSVSYFTVIYSTQ